MQLTVYEYIGSDLGKHFEAFLKLTNNFLGHFTFAWNFPFSQISFFRSPSPKAVGRLIKMSVKIKQNILHVACR